MKRIGRWLYWMLAVASLVFSVALVCQWVRSHWLTDQFNISKSGYPSLDPMTVGPCEIAWRLQTARGILQIDRQDSTYFPPRPFHTPPQFYFNVWTRPSGYPGEVVYDDGVCGFGGDSHQIIKRSYAGKSSRINTIINYSWFHVPIWFAVLLTSIFPIVAVWRFLRYDNRKFQGQCTNCGYDMRATPERCPECGAVPQIPPKTQPV